MPRLHLFHLPLLLLLLSLLLLLPSHLPLTSAQSCSPISSTPLNVSSNTFGRLVQSTGIAISAANLLQLTNLTVPASLNARGGVITSIAMNVDSNSGGTGSFRLAVYRQIAGILTLVTSTPEVTIGGGSSSMSVVNIPAVPGYLPPNPGPVLAAVWFSNGALGMYTDTAQTGSLGTVTVNYSYSSTGAFPATAVNGLDPFGLLELNLQMQYTVQVGCNLTAPPSSTAAPLPVIIPSSSALPAPSSSVVASSCALSSSTISSSAASSSAISSSIASSSAVSSSAASIPTPSCPTNASLNASSNTFGRLGPNVGIESSGQDLLQLTNLTVPAPLQTHGGVITSIAMNVDSNSGGTGSFRLAVYRQIAGILTLVTSTPEVTIAGGTNMSVVNIPAVPGYLPPNPGPVLAAVWFSNGALGMYTDTAQTGSLGTVTVNYSYSSTGAFPATVENAIDPVSLFEFNLQMQYTVAVCNYTQPSSSSALPPSSSAASSSALSSLPSSSASSSAASQSTASSALQTSPVSPPTSTTAFSPTSTSLPTSTPAPTSAATPSTTSTTPSPSTTSLPSLLSPLSSTASISSTTGAPAPSGQSLSAASRTAVSWITGPSVLLVAVCTGLALLCW